MSINANQLRRPSRDQLYNEIYHTLARADDPLTRRDLELLTVAEAVRHG